MHIFKISFFVLIGLTVSCGNSSKEISEEKNSSEVINQVQQEEEIALEEIEVLSIISDLNVRNTPGKEGVIIDKLAYGQRAIYYGEETDYKEKIIMRGEPRFSSWKKIRFSGSKRRGATDGWVYGEGVSRKGAIYREIDASHYSRNLTTVTSEELSTLLGLEILESGYSNGFIAYLKSANSTLLKRHGTFEITGRMKKHLKLEADFGYDLTGEFVQDKLEGSVIKKSRGSGVDYTCILSYSDGVCNSASISGTYLGTEINYQTENPTECSFSELEKTLQ